MANGIDDEKRDPDAIATESPTTHKKRAQFVAVALFGVVIIGLTLQTCSNMRDRDARDAKKEAEDSPRVAAAPTTNMDDFRKAQEAAQRSLDAANAAKAEASRRDAMLGSISGRTTAGATEPAVPPAADAKTSLEVVGAEFRAEEYRRVLTAGREGFGKASEAKDRFAPGQTNAPSGDLNPQLADIAKKIEEGKKQQAALRADSARLYDMARQIHPETAEKMIGPGNPADVTGAQGIPERNTYVGSPLMQLGGNSSDQYFGEASLNRAFRDPANAGPKPGELLLPTASIISAVTQGDTMSDYDGNWLAVLQRPVYDPTNEFILFPTGTKITGRTVRVSKVNEVIQNRMGYTVRWAIRPDGKRINFQRTAGVDAAGVAALKDQVDYHIAAQFFGVLAYAVVGLAPSSSDFGTEAQSSPDAAVQEGTQKARDLGRSFSAKYLQIVPTITIRHGTPMKIFVEDDIYVTPWAPVDARFYSNNDRS